MASRQIVIDCDPGVDDAIALLLAFSSPELEVLGITVVGGNVPLTLTQTNARRICELAKRTDVLVHAGCPYPMMRKLVTAPEVHGDTGLAAVELPEPQMPLQDKHGVDFLIDTLMNSAGDITLATLGPLTNIAIAMIKQPQITERIQELVLMGGGIAKSNISPSAEFNIFVDPHAAYVVLNSGVKLTMMPLDCTYQAIATPKRIAAIKAINTPVGTTVASLLEFYCGYYMERLGMAGCPIHDACVIAYLVAPQLFQGTELYVQVDTTSELNMGRTVVDMWKVTAQQPNINVIRTIDADGFFKLVTQSLAIL